MSDKQEVSGRSICWIPDSRSCGCGPDECDPNKKEPVLIEADTNEAPVTSTGYVEASTANPERVGNGCQIYRVNS